MDKPPGERIEWFGVIFMTWLKRYIGASVLISVVALLATLLLSRAATEVFSGQSDFPPTVVIDAGHGGEDGGAVSVTGVHESGVNLEISLRLNDMLHLLGIQTRMVRETDESVSTEGSTISQRKVSDIRNRVALVEGTPNALLVSVHQNQFAQSQYRGAQVFFAGTDGSQTLAEQLQATLSAQVDPNNHRQCKAARDIYLLEHVSCTAVLVECGFLSNPAEEALLQEAPYQKKLAAALAGVIYAHLEAENEV